MVSKVEDSFLKTKSFVREYIYLVAALIQPIAVVNCISDEIDVFLFDSIECSPLFLIRTISFLRSLVPCIPVILIVT